MQRKSYVCMYVCMYVWCMPIPAVKSPLSVCMCVWWLETSYLLHFIVIGAAGNIQGISFH